MTIRINGFAEAGVLGYYMGKNALVSIAINDADGIRLDDTGAVSSYVELQRVLGTTDAQTTLDYIVSKGIRTVDGAPWVLATVQAQYTASYAAQVNLQRLVDIVQQRAVISASSNPAHGVATTITFKGAPAGVYGNVSIASAEVLTFLVERADVFDLDQRTFQGVPTAVIEEGRNLINDIEGVPMLNASAVEVIVSSDNADSNFGVSVMKIIPAIF